VISVRQIAIGQPHPAKLAIVKWVHTVIYIVMASATIYVFASAMTGRRDTLLYIAVSLVAIEGAVFLANGMKCPLTTLAQRYGDPSGHVGDTLFPEACTRYTFRAFGSLYAIGVLLLVLDLLDA
jgi:hypothetical protein